MNQNEIVALAMLIFLVAMGTAVIVYGLIKTNDPRMHRILHRLGLL